MLFSFDGLDRCPVHGALLSDRICCETQSNAMVLHEKFTPFGTCRCGAVFLAFAAARSPKANPARDRALGEVADWLMHAGSRCWIGPPNPPDATVSLVRFTQRVARLKIALDLPDAIPRWAAVSDASLWDPSTVAVIACGSARMQGSDPDLQGTGIQWLDERHAHPYAWQQTVFGDFKAICRYLRHHTLGKGRRWIGRFARASDTVAIEGLLTAGGEEARRAWAVLIWWQTCIRDLRLENWLTSRAFRWGSVPGIPLLVDQRMRNKSGLASANAVQEWIARWVSAIGLVAFWRHAARQRTLPGDDRQRHLGRARPARLESGHQPGRAAGALRRAFRVCLLAGCCTAGQKRAASQEQRLRCAAS